jgi:HSP20 family molecular chaperone IbpA
LTHLSQQQLTIFAENKEEEEKKNHDDSGFAFRNALSATDLNVRVQADSAKEGRWWDCSPF